MDSPSPQVSPITPAGAATPAKPANGVPSLINSPGPISAPLAGATGEWPTVPPAPKLVKPESLAAPEPPTISPPGATVASATITAPGQADHADAATGPNRTSAVTATTVPATTAGTETTAPATTAGTDAPASGANAAPRTVHVAAVAPLESTVPTATAPTGSTAPTESASPAESGAPASRWAGRAPLSAPPEESPLLELQRSVRQQQGAARNPREDLVWQPRFAYASGVIILGAFAIVSLPLWLVLYRGAMADSGPRVADVMALCMMLLGGLLTCAAAWVIIIEMRGRVRMVDTLARTGEREAMAAPEIPVLDAPLAAPVVGAGSPALKRTPAVAVEQVSWEASNAALAARTEAQQVNAARTLEASSQLLSSFGGVLKSFGQLPAQVAMLAVALALFVGATVLSLN